VRAGHRGATGRAADAVNKAARRNAQATTAFTGGYATNADKVFAGGDMGRGLSLVVWAMR